MIVDIDYDEFYYLLEYRKNKYDRNRPSMTYDKECDYLNFDSDGDFCERGKGFGVNSRCWARVGKECPYYSASKN